MVSSLMKMSRYVTSGAWIVRAGGNCKLHPCLNYGNIVATNPRNRREHSSLCRSVSKPLLGCNINSVLNVQQRSYVFRDFYLKHFTPDNWPVATAMRTLEGIHDWTGLPWWVSIPLSAWMLRMLMLPLVVHIVKVMARLENQQPEFLRRTEQLSKEMAVLRHRLGWDEKTTNWQYAMHVRKIKREMYVRDNCHPMKSILIIPVQLPAWMYMSVGLRCMTGGFPGMLRTPVTPGLQTGGVLWFPNLLEPDPMCLLPVIFCVVNLVITEISILLVNKPQGKMAKVAPWLYRGLALIMLPVAISMPSAMTYYWTCSSLFGISQSLLLRSPRVRRLLRIPKTENESAHPYRELYARAKAKFTRKRA